MTKKKKLGKPIYDVGQWVIIMRNPSEFQSERIPCLIKEIIPDNLFGVNKYRLSYRFDGQEFDTTISKSGVERADKATIKKLKARYRGVVRELEKAEKWLESRS